MTRPAEHPRSVPKVIKPKLAPLDEEPPSKSASQRAWSDDELDKAVEMLHEHKHVSDSRNYAKANQARGAARTLQRSLRRDRGVLTSSRVWLNTSTRRWRWALTLAEKKGASK